MGILRGSFMKKLFVTVVAATLMLAANVGFAASASTITNAAPEIKYPWESSISAGLTLTSGNSDSTVFTAAIGTKRKTPINEYTFGADTAFGKVDSEKNVETYHAFGQYNHLFSERAFGYVRTEYLRDTVADIHYRVTISSGAGYYLIKTTNTTLAAEVGPGAVIQRLGGKSLTFATLRLGERFEHKFGPGTRVFQDAEILPQVDRLQNYIVNADIGAEAAMTKSLSLQVVLSNTYNSEPSAGRKRDDVKLVSGIVYKF
jgi:putative salt-induced outer membrane protein YdiY